MLYKPNLVQLFNFFYRVNFPDNIITLKSINTRFFFNFSLSCLIYEVTCMVIIINTLNYLTSSLYYSFISEKRVKCLSNFCKRKNTLLFLSLYLPTIKSPFVYCAFGHETLSCSPILAPFGNP